DKFSPNAQATRGMIVTVLFRCAEEQLRMESGELRIGDASHTDEKPAERFEDVLLGKYYSDAVAWAAENEIVGGVGGGRFAPDANITRQDLAVILTRYAEYKGLPLAALREYAAFSDDNAVSDYARAAVEACYRAGIISGKPNNLFDPKGEATRAEVAAMLHRFILAMAGDVEPDEEEA
ncbi:MAG: S-layer homology domain-containing protein, partial [Oscillospiraceae bacterium]|nr:S-layer homology domain-containing protein [Oscillospiraceae bacterium]